MLGLAPPVDLQVSEALLLVAVGSPSAYTLGALVAVGMPVLEAIAFSEQVREYAAEGCY